MIKLYFSITFLSLASLVFSQSAKTIRTYGISKKTETVVKYHNGEEISRYAEEIEIYNKDGKWIEKSSFNSDGELKSEQFRVYEDDEVVDEIKIDHNGTRAKKAKPASYSRVLSTYEKGDLVAERKVDKDGNTLKEKKFVYNKFGDLIEIITTDAEGNFTGKEEISYDNRGLKTSVRKLNQDETVSEEKLFTYE